MSASETIGRAFAALALAWLVLTSPRTAHAADRPDCGADLGTSLELRAYDCQVKGLARYNAASFREAIALFRRARELYPTVASLRSLQKACNRASLETPDRVDDSPERKGEKLEHVSCEISAVEQILLEQPHAA